MSIQPGDRIIALNARGEWCKGFAVSGVEPTHVRAPNGTLARVHDFPVIWVRLRRDADPMPWPVEDVRLAPERGKREAT